MQLQNYFAQDKSGNALPGATVYVLLAGTATMATGLQDKNGAAKTNPFLSDSQGLIQFAAANGDYDIRVVKGPHDYKLTSVRFDDVPALEARVDDLDGLVGTGGRWCGASATAPTTRLNGSPLQEGDEYQDTDNHLRYNWTGSAWVALNSSAQTLESELAAPGGTEKIWHLPPAPGALPTPASEMFGRTINVLDVLTSAERAEVKSRTPTTNINAKIQALLTAAPAGSRILFSNGVYLNAGAVGLQVTKAMTLDFEPGALLQFNHNNATYLQTLASDITLNNPAIDGGSASWTRTGNAAIRVRSNGSAVARINIVKPRIANVAGAGILVGWSDAISNVTVDNPVVFNTQADGVSVTYDTSDVQVIAPRCLNMRVARWSPRGDRRGAAGAPVRAIGSPGVAQRAGS